MSMKMLLVLSCVSLTLTGCLGGPEVKCGSEDSVSLVQQIVKDGVEKNVLKDGKQINNDLSAAFDGAKIRAMISKLNITVTDIRTTKNDPNSTKQFCAATLNISAPADLMTQADKAREMMSLGNLQKFAQEADIKLEANKISHEIEFSVQPTDDHKKVFAELDGGDKPMSFASEVISSALLKSGLEARQVEQAKAQAAEQAKAEQAAQAQAQAERELLAIQLQKAKSGVDDANRLLNTIWQSASKERREQLLPEQRGWLKQRDLECKIRAQSSGQPDATAQEIARLNCETEMTEQRQIELKNKILS